MTDASDVSICGPNQGRIFAIFGEELFEADSVTIRFLPDQPGIVLLLSRKAPRAAVVALYIPRDDEPCNATSVKFIARLTGAESRRPEETDRDG